MQPKIHIANTDFEFELANPSHALIDDSWSAHPLCLQLQFLPILYASPHDIVIVTALPCESDLKALSQLEWFQEGLPQFHLLSQKASFQEYSCICWGPSQRVACWARSCGIEIDFLTDWERVRELNSKVYSFSYNRLSHACLIHNEQELHAWCGLFEGPKVLKTCFGFSGKGNKQINHAPFSARLMAFCQQEWKWGRPIIGEPWLEKVLDFSTQWEILSAKDIMYVGATKFETNLQGIYRATIAGPQSLLFQDEYLFLEDHKKIAFEAIQDMATKGYRGSVGIDALIYRCPETHRLQLYPIVEINGRQTMSSVALRFQQKRCPQKLIRVGFQTGEFSSPSLLPSQLLLRDDKMSYFRQRLTIDDLDAIPIGIVHPQDNQSF